MSLNKQCKLLGVPRSSYYHKPKRKEGLLDELLMQAIDRIYMEEPTYGSRRIRDELQKLGYDVGRKRVQRLIRVMGIEPIYPKPRLSVPGKGHKKYPYLLRNLNIKHSNHVWCTDITYIPNGVGISCKKLVLLNECGHQSVAVRAFPWWACLRVSHSPKAAPGHPDGAREGFWGGRKFSKH